MATTATSFRNIPFEFRTGKAASYVTSSTGFLSAGHYMPQFSAMTAILPKPSYTNDDVWSPYRVWPAGYKMRVPFEARGGAFPYIYSHSTLPSGATMVKTYSDAQRANYGVLEWTTPVAGTYDFSVRAVDQDGASVSWSCRLVVYAANSASEDAMFSFIAPSNSGDGARDGTRDHPWISLAESYAGTMNPTYTQRDYATVVTPKWVVFTEAGTYNSFVSYESAPTSRTISAVTKANPGVVTISAPKTISGATKASPLSLTITGHGYSANQYFAVSGVAGMTELNGNTYKVKAVTDANTITVKSILDVDVDSTAFGTYTSGGTANSHNLSEDQPVYISGVGGMTQLNGNVYRVGVPITGDTFTLKSQTKTGVDTSAFGTYTSGGTADNTVINARYGVNKQRIFFGAYEVAKPIVDQRYGGWTWSQDSTSTVAAINLTFYGDTGGSVTNQSHMNTLTCYDGLLVFDCRSEFVIDGGNAGTSNITTPVGSDGENGFPFGSTTESSSPSSRLRRVKRNVVFKVDGSDARVFPFGEMGMVEKAIHHNCTVEGNSPAAGVFYPKHYSKDVTYRLCESANASSFVFLFESGTNPAGAGWSNNANGLEVEYCKGGCAVTSDNVLRMAAGVTSCTWINVRFGRNAIRGKLQQLAAGTSTLTHVANAIENSTGTTFPGGTGWTNTPGSGSSSSGLEADLVGTSAILASASDLTLHSSQSAYLGRIGPQIQ